MPSHKPMTAAWSKGCNGRYAYYFCQTKTCAEHRKSIRKDLIENDFETLLTELRPSPQLFFMAYEMLGDLWQHRQANAATQNKVAKSDLVKLQRKTDQLMDRLVQTDSHALITAYENQIRKLEEDKTALSEKIKNCGRPLTRFKDTYRTAFAFLSNPQKLWASDRIEDRRLVLRLTFSGKLPYMRNEGYRTAETTLPFKVLAGISSNKYDLVVYAVLCEPVSASISLIINKIQGINANKREYRIFRPCFISILQWVTVKFPKEINR